MMEKIKGNDSYEKIFIINPRKAVEKNSGVVTLSQLTQECGARDALIWDNYPNDRRMAYDSPNKIEAVKNDYQYIRDILWLITSINLKNLFVALNPNYLELYRNLADTNPDIYTKEIIYDKNKIKDILVKYGECIYSFQSIYRKHIENDIESISRSLWERQPTPSAVLLFYNTLLTGALQQSKYFSAIDFAKEFELPEAHYDIQFRLINSQRHNEADFLLSLKLSYELGVERTFDSLKRWNDVIW